jgi:hypothetical protein
MSDVKIIIRAGESLVEIVVDRAVLAERLTATAEISKSKGKRPGQPPNLLNNKESYSPETLCTRFVAIEAPKKTNNP